MSLRTENAKSRLLGMGLTASRDFNEDKSAADATITFNSDGTTTVIISVDSHGRTFDSGKIHEVGHAKDARINREGLRKDAKKAQKDKGGPAEKPHNERPLLRQEIYVPGSSFFQQTFAYDSLNRLTSVAEKLNGAGADTFKQAYTFDRWGNRTIDQNNTTTNVPHPEYTVDPANNNRLLAPAGYTHEYDAAGNQTRDTFTTNSPTAGRRTFDAENRITEAQKPVSGKVSWAYYTYDGNGQRVRRKIATFEIWQVDGFGGELLAEYPQTGPSLAVAQPQKEYGYRDGQLLVTLEPFANLAWNQPATQTDTLDPLATAGKAVDGDVDGELAAGHTAATNSHANSWWQVDLQSVQTISNLTVWGRTDCCPQMTSDFYVLVSDSPFTSTDLNTTINQAGVSNYLHAGFSGPSASSGPTSINVSRTGRYVRVQLAGTGSLALGEVQIWSAAAKVKWMVTDHLGTPRMIVDQTGSLNGVSRHDYLPFGEELFAGTGGRATTQGYSAPDGVRQQFTQKERDTETGLDYFLARYYSSTQGRFTSSDPLFASARPSLPQSWNRYSYVLNNPVRLVDPNGFEDEESQKQKPITLCSQVKIDAKIDQKPKFKENKTFTDANGNVLKGTGVEGRIVFTVKVDDQPTSGVKISETNQVNDTKNGKPMPQAPVIEGTATTNADGQFGDYVGNFQTTDGTKATNDAIKSDYSNNTLTSTGPQTVTLTLPDGATCTATSTRTLTNAGPKGPSSKFTLTTTQPVVKP